MFDGVYPRYPCRAACAFYCILVFIARFRGMRVKRVRCVCAFAFSSEDSGSRKWYSNAIYRQRYLCLTSAHQSIPVGLSRDKIILCGKEVEAGWKVL